MDFSLSDEQRLLIQTARSFVENELYPHEAEVDRAGEVPGELAAQIRSKAIAAGLFAANVPMEFGGGGLGTLDMYLLEREFGRASWALQGLIARPTRILLACTGEQIPRYLSACVRGEKIECFALTEPGAGSDATGITTRARRDGDDWVIDGRKHFISHADVADFAIVFAVTGEDPTSSTSRRSRNRITAFLVDVGTPGFEVIPGPRVVSHRGYNIAELSFDGCRVSSARILGEEGKGFEIAEQWLSDSRLMVAANCVGRARRVLDMAADWAATREQFGRTIGRFQGVGFKIADMATEVEAGDMLAIRAAWLADRGEMEDSDAAMAKLFASEMLGRVTDNAVQIFGGMGLVDELPIERFWRDARIERIWDGTSEIQRHIISRSILRPREQR
jgi:acyl-CoA dehydrogenase